VSRRYAVQYAPAALRHLRKLPAGVAQRILPAIDQLREDPRPPGVKAMVGRRGYYRIRAGDYRVIYTVRDAELLVMVVEIGHRREVYDR
jgi:mRNA interferase RelE/StbE